MYVVYDDNEPLSADPHLIVPLERYHSNHVNPDCRAYKLSGIYLDDKLTFNYHTGGAVCKGATPSVEQPGGRGFKPRLRSLLD